SSCPAAVTVIVPVAEAPVNGARPVGATATEAGRANLAAEKEIDRLTAPGQRGVVPGATTVTRSGAVMGSTRIVDVPGLSAVMSNVPSCSSTFGTAGGTAITVGAEL